MARDRVSRPPWAKVPPSGLVPYKRSQGALAACSADRPWNQSEGAQTPAPGWEVGTFSDRSVRWNARREVSTTLPASAL